MAEPRGIYDPDPIQPVCKMGENIGVWSQGRWNYFTTDYIEPLPRGRGSIIDFGAIAAGGIVAATILGIYRLDDNQMLQLRFRPLDDVLCRLWEQRSQGKFNSKFVHCDVSLMTEEYDPFLATTTFFVLGKERDAFLEVENPLMVAQAMSRVFFWGYRYLLVPLVEAPAVLTYTVAEGRAA